MVGIGQINTKESRKIKPKRKKDNCMEDKILNLNLYKEELRNHYNSILHNRILLMQPLSWSDEELYSCISSDETSVNLSLNPCSWYTIGNTKELEYFVKYKVVELEHKNSKPIIINYSRFKYPITIYDLSFFRGILNINGISTIDSRTINPEVYFIKHQKEKIFFVCGLKGKDCFNRESICYLFAKDRVQIIDFRRYILKAQIVELHNIITNPLTNLPDTTIVTTIGNTSRHQSHICGSPSIYKEAIEIYEKEFKLIFQELLKNKIKDVTNLQIDN